MSFVQIKQPKTEPARPAEMTLRCLLALAILTLLVTADYLILKQRIETSKLDGRMIGVAAQQRILFERTSLLARYFINAPDDREKENTRELLLEAIYELDAVKDTIFDKSFKAGEDPVPDEIRRIYHEAPYFLEKRMDRYLTALKELASTRNQEVFPQDSRFPYIRNVASGKLLRVLDEITEFYQNRARQRIQNLLRQERSVFGITLISIAATWFLIFLPMIHESRLKMNQLQSMNQSLERVNAQLENLAKIDPLTGTLNRRGLQQVLSREISWADREGWDTHALLIDLDNFKSINDSMGYAIGDVVLTEVANRLNRAIRSTDYLARIGGDEFMILLPKTNQAEAVEVAQKVRLRVSETVIELASGDSPVITSSIGLGPADQETPSIDELLARIYPALKDGKRSGKNRVCTFRQEPPSGQDALETVVHKLQNGGYLYALRQPIVDLETGRTIAYEMLSRSSIPSYESPDLFFRIALEKNILTVVDHQCFKICGDASNGSGHGLRWHFNLFPSTILNIPTENLLSALPKTGKGTSYCIEISEEQIIGEPSYLTSRIQALKKSGMLVAIDDVGFGRSCLESLILLEPQIIKIDKKCVRGIEKVPSRTRALKRLLKLVFTLKADVVVEGIESEAELNVLKDCGVRYGQGYFLGRPV